MRKKHRPMSEINVVPYIDVMLVLLVIFMITAPLLKQGVNVDLPKAAAKAVDQRKQEPIIVSVNAKGKYFLNIATRPSHVMPAHQLAKRITEALTLDPKRQVLVKGDRHVDYGKVVQAMVLLQHAGAKSVGLMTEPK